MQIMNVGFRIMQFIGVLCLPGLLWAVIREYIGALKVLLSREGE